MTNLNDRLTAAETALAHLQHDYDALNEALLHQAELIKTLEKRLEDVGHRLGGIESADPPVDPADERPPHY